MRSTDPDFETKAADVIGLYLNPPRHAVVFCVDEKTAIQALDRVDPRLPLSSPGRAERHGFEYYRHGTLSLYAALNTHTGKVVGSAVPRQTSDEFVTFLQSVVDTQPLGRAIHVIVDSLSAHRTQKVRTFLAAHPTASSATTRSTRLRGLAVVKLEQAAESLATLHRAGSDRRCRAFSSSALDPIWWTGCGGYVTIQEPDGGAEVCPAARRGGVFRCRLARAET